MLQKRGIRLIVLVHQVERFIFGPQVEDVGQVPPVLVAKQRAEARLSSREGNEFVPVIGGVGFDIWIPVHGIGGVDTGGDQASVGDAPGYRIDVNGPHVAGRIAEHVILRTVFVDVVWNDPVLGIGKVEIREAVVSPVSDIVCSRVRLVGDVHEIPSPSGPIAHQVLVTCRRLVVYGDDLVHRIAQVEAVGSSNPGRALEHIDEQWVGLGSRLILENIDDPRSGTVADEGGPGAVAIDLEGDDLVVHALEVVPSDAGVVRRNEMPGVRNGPRPETPPLPRSRCICDQVALVSIPHQVIGEEVHPADLVVIVRDHVGILVDGKKGAVVQGQPLTTAKERCEIASADLGQGEGIGDNVIAQDAVQPRSVVVGNVSAGSIAQSETGRRRTKGGGAGAKGLVESLPAAGDQDESERHQRIKDVALHNELVVWNPI